MDKKKIDKELNKTFANIKDYLTLKKDYYSLILTERLSKILTRFIVIIVSTMLLLFFILFISFAIVSWLNRITDSEIFGYVIIAFFYLALVILMLVFQKQLFLNPLIKGINSMILEDEEINDILDNIENHDDDEEEKAQ